MGLHEATTLLGAVEAWHADEECRNGALRDLAEHGCGSGMVSGLIYYTETNAFYLRHQQEIGKLLGEICADDGCSPSSPSVLFERAGWDAEDPLAAEECGTNRNILAWFAFEETARSFAEAKGIEI